MFDPQMTRDFINWGWFYRQLNISSGFVIFVLQKKTKLSGTISISQNTDDHVFKNIAN